MKFFGTWIALILVFASFATRVFAQQHVPQPEPLSWERVVDLALQNNPDFKIAQLQVEQVEGRIIADRAKFLPNLTGYGLTLPPTAIFNFSQVEFTPAMLHLKAAFQGGRSAAAVNVQLSLTEMINKLRVAYAEALYKEKVVPIRQKELTLLEERYTRTEALFNVGNATKDQLYSLKVKIGLASDDVKKAQTNAELARIALAEAIGLSIGDPRVSGPLTGDFVTSLPPEMDLNRLKAKALSTRQDLKVLEQLKLVADETIRLTASAAYPIVGVGGTLFMSDRPKFMKPVLDAFNTGSVQKDEDDNDINNSRVTLLQGVTWRIFDGGNILGAIREARATALQQSILLNQTREMIPAQVAVAREALLSSYQLLKAQEKNINPSESVRLAKSAYDAGQASQLEVIDAQEAYITYELAMLNLRYTVDVANATLDRVLGDKVVILDEPAPKGEPVALTSP